MSSNRVSLANELAILDDHFRNNSRGTYFREREAIHRIRDALSTVETKAPTREQCLETALGQWLHDFGSTNELSQRTRILLGIPHPVGAQKTPRRVDDKCEHGIPRRFCTALHEDKP